MGISDILLSRISEFVAARMGLHYPKERWRDLERGICSATREFGFKDVESCFERLMSSPVTKNQIETLASHLTVGETYFFREKKIFKIIEEHILPELISSRCRTDQCLRFWSAGCSTGEEPYSIAILLAKMIPDLKDWNITILATDINPRSLQKASDGAYGEWSFRDTPLWIKERYFKKTRDNRLEILSSIKKMVTFSYHNLAEDTYPSLLNNTNAMDIIFCRNVLMYFTPELASKLIKKFYRSLMDCGWILVSPSETSHILFSQFATVNFSDAILYKKDSKMPQTAEVFLKPPPDQQASLPSEIPEQNVPESQPSPYMEALALYQEGRYAEAVDKIQGLVSYNQDESKVFALLVRAYANQGRLYEALEWCEKAITSDKLNSVLHYLHSTILQEHGLTDKAIISLKRSLYLDRNFVLAYFALGNLTLRQRKFRESKKHFKNVLMLLSGYRKEEILPESDGITAGRLSEIIRSIIGKEGFTS